MIHVAAHSREPLALPSIERVIEEFGAWKVMLASVRALVVRKDRKVRMDPRRLNDHLRRDIGLEPMNGFGNLRMLL